MTEERKETRKLVAIMFIDMVGFSRMMHQNEEKTLRLVDEKDRLIADVVSHHRGRVLKTMGDGTFADFSSATDAVNCAVEIQTQLREYNKNKGPSVEIAIRIGIHIGDVIVRDGDIFGDGVNVAARLEPLSEPGGICLSQAVYQATRSRSGVHPVLVGEVELKNILEKHVIYRIPPFYDSHVEDVPRTVERSWFSFGVRRIERLPSPRRSLLMVTFVTLLASPFAAFFIAFLVGAFAPNEPYRIWRRELVDPTAIVTAVQQRKTDAVKSIWASLDKDTRRSINAFDPRQADEADLNEISDGLRRGLNKLIRSVQPIFADRVIAKLEVPEVNRTHVVGDDLKRANRLLVEAAFPGLIQRYVGELPMIEKGRQALSDLGDDIRHPLKRRWFVIVLFSGLLGTSLMVVLTGSLTTIRVSFKDICNVDALLEYFIRGLGFRAPRKTGDSLIFRATWRTIFVYGVFQIEAKISGNRVILTGPLLLMRRLEKRFLSFAES